MNRIEHRKKIISALTEAQKIAFAPLTFQAIAAMLEFGILKQIDNASCSIQMLTEKLHKNEYAIRTLLEAGEAIGIVTEQNDVYSITPLGQTFLYDEMTRVNFNFVKDVCYSGAENLSECFTEARPNGLKKIFSEAKTIYSCLTKLPEPMKTSWFEFDHYYSDNCFDIIYKIITPVNKIFDIGANTGKFERVCKKFGGNIELNLIDLAENIEVIRDNPELAGCKFYAADILEKSDNLPSISGAVVMSQFLDCFSPDQIKFILQKIAKASAADTKIYILEPFIDRQKFEGAKYSLVHTSLYFTCMANGCSKMYSLKEMETLIKDSGLKINALYDALGAHDYTLVECEKNV